MMLISKMITNELLNKILNFDNQFHNDIFISFIENSMYVAIAHDKDLFEPTVWTSNLNFDSTYQHFLDLYYPISIIESIAIHKSLEDDNYNSYSDQSVDGQNTVSA